jgi:hypothetical protein
MNRDKIGGTVGHQNPAIRNPKDFLEAGFQTPSSESSNAGFQTPPFSRESTVIRICYIFPGFPVDTTGLYKFAK